jgi:hypothetical protein
MVAAKKRAPASVLKKIPGSSVHPLYGRPIEQIIKTGSLAQMKVMAKTARAHVNAVSAALAKLDAKIKSSSAKPAAKSKAR